MARRLILIATFLMMLFIYSCSRRTHPARTTSDTTTGNTASSSATTEAVKKKARVPVARVIVVNDSAARKSVDGRLYYDVMGHRYWRNNKDGKYYLFNKSMYTNPDFKSPG